MSTNVDNKYKVEEKPEDQDTVKLYSEKCWDVGNIVCSVLRVGYCSL